MEQSTRLRPLFILKILYAHTDENHCVTIAQILQFLRDEYDNRILSQDCQRRH